MSNQPEIKNAKYIALYYSWKNGGRYEGQILGNSVAHLANWAFMEKPIEENGYGYKFNIFKLIPVDRTEFNRAVKRHNKQKEITSFTERKAELLAELEELEAFFKYLK